MTYDGNDLMNEAREDYKLSINRPQFQKHSITYCHDSWVHIIALILSRKDSLSVGFFIMCLPNLIPGSILNNSSAASSADTKIIFVPISRETQLVVVKILSQVSHGDL